MTMGSLLSHSLRQVLLIPFHLNDKEKGHKEMKIPSCPHCPQRGFISLPFFGVFR